MKKITATITPTQGMSAEDINNFMDWAFQMLPLNLFDADVVGYPRTVMVRVQNEEEPLLYMPLQSVLMFDSLAPKPGLSPRHEALCLSRIGEVVEQAAQASGHRELWFVCRDDRVADLCSRHGFEELKNVRVLRKKLPPPEPTEGPSEAGS